MIDYQSYWWIDSEPSIKSFPKLREIISVGALSVKINQVATKLRIELIAAEKYWNNGIEYSFLLINRCILAFLYPSILQTTETK